MALSDSAQASPGTRSTRRPRRFEHVRAWDWPTRAVALAMLIATIGASIPLGIMVHGVLANDLTYKTWTWPAIPAIWLGCLLGGAITLRYRTMGSIVLVGAAAAGAYAFEPERGIFTFGLAWLIGIGLYIEGTGLLRSSPE